jgi:hypothetical protein
MIHISFTDQWQTLLDENGKPLIGRVKFFNADSTQYKSIYYDMQGETQGENPQYTLQDGRLEHQVFIGAGVYTCKVEKFVGTDVSSMRDHSNDDTYWSPYKEFKIYGGAEEVEGGSDLSAGFCDTIAALRLVDPSEHGVVSVIGYYSKEDGIEPRTYVWVDGNNDAEDYGSTIVSSVTGYTSAGRWKLCESPILCATTFGVFPNRESTITPSNLSDKATALATFSTQSTLCQSVFFESGHYVFAIGTTLNFVKKVITDAKENDTIKFDIVGYEDDNPPVGTISIYFIGGIECSQSESLSHNFENVEMLVGAGTLRTSWLTNSTDDYKNIDKCALFENIECILDSNIHGNFCSENKTFHFWHFYGQGNTRLKTIPNGCTFNECTFDGVCFRKLGTNLTFLNCGEVSQNQFPDLNFFYDDCIWNADGTIKSVGTKFLARAVVFDRNYTGDIDNTALEPDVGCVLTTSVNVTGLLKLKCIDRKFILNTDKIDFSNSAYIYADMFLHFDDAVELQKSVQNKFIDLVKGVYSYNRVVNVGDTEKSFSFRNGTISFTKSVEAGATDVYDLIRCSDYCFLTLSDNNHYYLETSLHTDVTINGSQVVLARANCESTKFIINSNCVLVDMNGSYVNCKMDGDFRITTSTNTLRQKFVGCDFTHPLDVMPNTTLYSQSNEKTYVNIVVEGCTFNFANQGVKLEAIHPNYKNNFVDEFLSNYSIKGNSMRGDAYLRNVEEYETLFFSTTDGSQPLEPTEEYCQGIINSYMDGFFSANFTLDLESKLFSFSNNVSYSIKAKILNQFSVKEVRPQSGRYTYFFPVSDVIRGKTKFGIVTEKKAVIQTKESSSVTDSELRELVPSLEWYAKIEKI